MNHRKKLLFYLLVFIIIIAVIIVYTFYYNSINSHDEHSYCTNHGVIRCYNDEFAVTFENIECSGDEDCSREYMNSYCAPGFPNLLECSGATYYCDDDGYCKGCDCSY